MARRKLGSWSSVQYRKGPTFLFVIALSKWVHAPVESDVPVLSLNPAVAQSKPFIAPRAPRSLTSAEARMCPSLEEEERRRRDGRQDRKGG